MTDETGAFAGDDLDDRLDRACDAADTSPPDEAAAALRALLPELEQQAARLPGSASALDDLARRAAAEGRAHLRAGRFDDALAQTRAAMAHHADAADLDPVGGRGGALASLRLRCAEILDRAQRLAEALAEARAAASEAESLAEGSPGDPRPVALAMDCHRAAGSLLGRLGDVPAAVGEYEETVRLARARLTAAPDDASAALGAAAALRDLGWARTDLPGAAATTAALAALAGARAVLEGRAAREPSALVWQSELSLLRALVSTVLRMSGRHDEAVAEMEAATFLAESVASLDPSEMHAFQVVRRLEGMGDTHLARRDAAAAVAAYRRRLEAGLRLLPGDAVIEGLARLDLGDALYLGGDAAGAVTELVRARELLEGPAAQDIGLLLRLGAACARLADARGAAGDADGELDETRRAADVWRRATVVAPELAEARERLAMGLLRLCEELGARDDLAAAETVGREALAAAEARASLPHAPLGARVLRADIASRLAYLLTRLDRPADAVPVARTALELRRALLAESPDDDAVARSVCWDAWRLARVLLDCRDLGAAEAAARESVGLADAHVRGDGRDGRDDGDDDGDGALPWLFVAAAAHDALGDVLLAREDRDGAAEHAAREADLSERRARALGDDAEAWEATSRCLREAAWSRDTPGARPDAATLDLLARAVAAQRAAVEHAADRAAAERALADALRERGWGLHRAREFDAALNVLREALVLAEAASSAAPGDRTLRAELADTYAAIESAATELERPADAEPAARAALVLRRELLAGGDDDDDERALRWAVNALGHSLLRLGRPQEARPLFVEGLELCDRRLAAFPADLDAKGLLSNLREGLADAQDRSVPAERETARRLYAANVELFRRHTPAELHHSDDCTCLADNERKLAELADGTDGAGPAAG